jgi:hypothetical protein
MLKTWKIAIANKTMHLLVTGVVDRHRVDVDPDPNFHFWC